MSETGQTRFIDKIVCHIKLFKDCLEDEKQKILKLLTIAFGPDNDPFLIDNALVVMLFYKSYLVGVVSGIENYYLVKDNINYESNRASYYLNYDKKGVFIYNLAVLKSCRGNGLGKSLVRVLMNHFKKVGVEYFHVQINEDNEGSNRIFKGQGFTVRKNLMADDNNKFNVLTYFV
jgi:ribosomal protein S18 acetylase RimI-like enzyme